MKLNSSATARRVDFVKYGKRIGSTQDASMAISFEKTKAMPIHEKVPVTETKEEEAIALNL